MSKQLSKEEELIYKKRIRLLKDIGAYSSYIQNAKRCRSNKQIKRCLSNETRPICASFFWGETKQGHDYWRNIDKLIADINF